MIRPRLTLEESVTEPMVTSGMVRIRTGFDVKVNHASKSQCAQRSRRLVLSFALAHPLPRYNR